MLTDGHESQNCILNSSEGLLHTVPTKFLPLVDIWSHQCIKQSSLTSFEKAQQISWGKKAIYIKYKTLFKMLIKFLKHSCRNEETKKKSGLRKPKLTSGLICVYFNFSFSLFTYAFPYLSVICSKQQAKFQDCANGFMTKFSRTVYEFTHRNA